MELMSRTWSRTTRKENQVLKLVHPGGFVELHTNPIMACEVLKKNPRHCVTRPDIFRFPWIVISPESILTPGNVFFIVPCHTIRHLLKSTHSTNSNSALIKHHRDRFLRKHANNEYFVDQDRHRHSNNKQSSLSTSTSREGTSNGGNTDQSFVTERAIYYSSEYSTSHDAGKVRLGTATTNDNSEQIPKLKSCLKKDMSHDARKRNLKVRFDCTKEGVRQHKQKSVTSSKF